MRDKFNAFIHSFPIQLVFHHLRRNLALVFLWLLFIATVSGGIGRIYGIHYLYLDPEYMDHVNFWSFFLVGLAFGNFTMAYHITCYILDSHRFAFVGILERPFAKFSLNNSIIPLIAFVVYLVLLIRFQINNEFSGNLGLILNILGLLIGIAVMLAFFFLYFKFTNKDIFRFLAGSVDKRLRKSKLSRERMMNKLTETRQRRIEVTSYLDLKLRVQPCERLSDFYDKSAVLKVFDQNHFNSVVVELAVIFMILFLGTFMDNQYFQIPAAASSLLLFSFVLMLVGAVSYWLRGWGTAFVFALFFVVNLLVRTGVIKGQYEARGLDYHQDPVPYSLDELRAVNNPEMYRTDSLKMIEILENWKQKQPQNKPHMVMLCVSGGGQRAALWTLNALQAVDSTLGEPIMEKVPLITGASGGMIGAAYYRELILEKKEGNAIPTKSEQLRRMGRDNLNAIIFSLLVNDAFFRVRKVTYGKSEYLKDRGYIFEQNLNDNLGGIFDKKIADYRQPEINAEIPMMLMSPVIANDGRKLFISPQHVSFMNMMRDVSTNTEHKISGVDFLRLFNSRGADSLNFLTALRMSASFPYITPTVSLPSDPPIEIMDAGIADNFGVGDATRFVFVFRKWIEQNTSGVTFLIIRDTRKNAPIEPKSSSSLVDKLTYPIASVYNNLGNIQDINNEAKIDGLRTWLELPVHMVEIEYNTYTNITEDYLLSSKALERKQLERASLSWHLTTKERQNVIENIQLENNQKALERLKSIIQE